MPVIADMIKDHELSDKALVEIQQAIIWRVGYRDVLASVKMEMESELNALVNAHDPQSGWFDALSYERSKLSEIIDRMDKEPRKWMGEPY